MTLGDRIKERRNQLGLTQEELASMVSKRVPSMKFSRVSLSNVELGIQNSVKDVVLLALVDFLKCNANWLVLGKGPIEFVAGDGFTNSQETDGITVCPLLTWEQANNFADTGRVSSDDFEYIACPSVCGKSTFVTKVRGDSMTPRFEEGDLIFVDPDSLEPLHGKLVVAKFDSASDITFKQVQSIDGSLFLTALNPSYPPELKYVNASQHCKIIGSVVAHVKPL
ncbi:helix-turn-helix domain-containing protein [Grimontia kaedaensis]|uniref:Helix-turn-helix domain-containing protein n=1 Tax=Grimontia kaedaensis TaxID=2872157 RepID=A0ABY4WXH4_9GAMM|nr:S24 family peptidase [Grimontia kaedaensis]USH03673.1 helix-turn-helix domain-containing protein [Grimontia kaedaensis]